MRYNLKSALKVQRIYDSITRELINKRIRGNKLVYARRRHLTMALSAGAFSNCDYAHWFQSQRVTTSQ